MPYDRAFLLKKGCLLLLAAAVVFGGMFVISLGITAFRLATAPKPVEISETDLLHKLQTHQIVLQSTSVWESSVDGADVSHGMGGYYQIPGGTPGGIRFETTPAPGSDTALLAALKRYGADAPGLRPRAFRLVRILPYVIFLLIACAIFREQIASQFEKSKAASDPPVDE